MGLTNFELWAADGSSGSSLPLDFETNSPHSRHLNPFDTRVVPQLHTNLNHLSSNGYYGFSYVNAAHDIELNNDNNNNNNNTATHNLNAVNGVNNPLTNTTTNTQHTNAASVNFGSSAHAAGHAVNVTRCKKRFFVASNDDDDDCTVTAKNYYSNGCEVSAKRCRFDDDFSAQYINDFFQLPSTQIAIQSCLMDTEEGLAPPYYHHQQQQQVDEEVFEKNNNIIEKTEHKICPQLQTVSAHQRQLQTEQQEHHHHQQQQQHHHHQQQQLLHQQQESQQQHLYHQQHQHYQGHLHRANRDVSRCMLSHMI